MQVFYISTEAARQTSISLPDLPLKDVLINLHCQRLVCSGLNQQYSINESWKGEQNVKKNLQPQEFHEHNHFNLGMK